jgi:predicted RNA-binding protein
MLLRSSHRNIILIAFAGLLPILALSCGQADRYAGTYLANGESLAEQAEMYIELQEHGVGIWRVLDDEASFRWDVRADEIRLHTRSGGVIVGKIQGDILEIALPGKSIQYFRKAGKEKGEYL